MIGGVAFVARAGDDIAIKGVNQIEPGTYIFVSFSMSDQSLRQYFEEANGCGGKLIMIGLTGDKNGRNRFSEMRNRVEKAKINIDINPTLFEQLNIKKVPVIAVVKKDGSVKKISGHITLAAALEIMKESEVLNTKKIKN